MTSDGRTLEFERPRLGTLPLPSRRNRVNTVAPCITQPPYYLSRSGQDFGPYALVDLQTMASRRQLGGSDLVRQSADASAFPARDIPWVFSSKSWLVAV